MKRSSSIFMGLLLALSLCFGTPFVSFATGTTTLYLSDNSPSVGDKVTLSVSGSDSSTITVRYSSDVLTFDNCNVAGYSSDGNTVTFYGKTGDITFKAASGGKADMIVSSDALAGSSASVTVASEEAAAEPEPEPEAEPEAEPETEPEVAEEAVYEEETAPAASSSKPSENGDYNIDGVDYVISERYDDSEVPAGFERETLEIHGKTYSEPVNDKMALLYLKPADKIEGKGEFYIYDKAADSVSKMFILGSKDRYVICLNADTSAFSMLTDATVSVDDESIPVYQLSDSTNDFYYVYGVDQDMEEEWYTYRDSTGEVARADTYALFLTGKSADADDQESEDEETSEEKGILPSFSSDQIRNVVVVVVIILAIVIIFIINLHVFRRNDDDDDIWAEPEKEDDGEDDDEPAPAPKKRRFFGRNRDDEDEEEEDEEADEDEEPEEPEENPVPQAPPVKSALETMPKKSASTIEPKTNAPAPEPKTSAVPGDTKVISQKPREEDDVELPTEEAILKNAMAGIMEEDDKPKKVSAIDSLPKKKGASGDDNPEITMIDLNNL